ncbi:MAG TPA: DUF2306 domain-containing protein [Propionibacteriaceae bacterium]|nr:DUF2306 domain-containing protein [Propionibacteriaceae bacterium]
MAKPGWVIMTILSLVTIAFVVRYLAFNPDTYFPEQRQVYQQREFILGVHVLSGMLALLVGPFQFVSKIRHRFLRVHRSLGVVYIASCTGLGLSGLALATTSFGGWSTSLAFGLLGLSMLFTTWTALRMVLAGRIGDHRRWMIRSFSLIFAGVMLRVLSPIYGLLSAVGLVSFSFETAYTWIAWLCWVPNLLIAVWITRRPRLVA